MNALEKAVFDYLTRKEKHKKAKETETRQALLQAMDRVLGEDISMCIWDACDGDLHGTHIRTLEEFLEKLSLDKRLPCR